MLKVGLFIEPWIKQRAGISVFTEQLAMNARHSKFLWVTIGSKDMGVGLEHIYVPSRKSSFYNPFRWVGALKFDLEHLGIDVLIDPGHYSTQGLFSGASRFAVVHDITPYLYPSYHRVLTRVAYKLWMENWLLQSKKIITVSDQTKMDVEAHYGMREKLVRIYPGVQQMNIEAIDNTGQQPNQPYVLAVGTAEPRKNHKTLIKVFERFGQRNKAHRLVIVGGSGWKVDLPQLVAESSMAKRIEIRGFVPKNELVHLYKNASFCAYISFYEGFGFPIVEAMKLGCPVMTSNIGSMKEVAGQAAELIDPKSAEDVAKAMERLVMDKQLRDERIALGLKRAEVFSWLEFIVRLDTEIDSIVVSP